MKRLICFICYSVAIFIITGGLGVSSAFCQTNPHAEIGTDLILLLDSSRSMRNSYPENLEKEAIDYIVEFLKKYNMSQKNRISIVHFASDVYLTQKLTGVNEKIERRPRKGLDVQYTLFAPAFELAHKEFIEADSFSGTHIPQIFLITDGQLYHSTKEFEQYSENRSEIEKVRQNLIRNKLIPIMSEFKRKGCAVNVLCIERQRDKMQRLEDEREWKKFAHDTGGLFYSVGRSEFNALKNIDLSSIEINMLFILSLHKLIS
ncbi:vWA domain-containing protein [Desulfonema magnum]|uniref:von Willebrand factor A-like domain-containing protein n=1 Tax=Desulfonema magnum TaxID=45655 RepID=A0A975BJC9_9BACT|nr:vWA domain-containing protein [Desulfonema magnum]QTA86521.1 von Willebrand factor A-like domain-containing protein [Desulfonema magnum]